MAGVWAQAQRVAGAVSSLFQRVSHCLWGAQGDQNGPVVAEVPASPGRERRVSPAPIPPQNPIQNSGPVSAPPSGRLGEESTGWFSGLMDRVYEAGSRALDFLSLAWVFREPVAAPERLPDPPPRGYGAHGMDDQPPATEYPNPEWMPSEQGLSEQEWPPMPITRGRWSPFQALREQNGHFHPVTLQAVDNAGAGNCFFYSIARAVAELMVRDPALREPLQQELLEIAEGAQTLSERLHQMGEGPDGLFADVAAFIDGQRELLVQAAETVGERVLRQDQVRAWAALLVLLMPTDDLALLESVLGMAGPQVEQVDWDSRLLAASEITTPRVMGVDALRHLLSAGVLRGRIGLISMRGPPAGGASIQGIETRWREETLPVIDQADPIEGQEPALPEVMIVHVGLHFFTARQPRQPRQPVLAVQQEAAAVQAAPTAEQAPAIDPLQPSA